VLMSASQRPLRWRAMPVEFEAPFVSRGDKSGTNAAELQLWKAAGPTPDASKEKWYRDIGGGMGQALNAASAMDAHTLSDRGTWLSFKKRVRWSSLLSATTPDQSIRRHRIKSAKARRLKARHGRSLRIGSFPPMGNKR
jgi:hypothetical protein